MKKRGMEKKTPQNHHLLTGWYIQAATAVPKHNRKKVEGKGQGKEQKEERKEKGEKKKRYAKNTIAIRETRGVVCILVTKKKKLVSHLYIPREAKGCRRKGRRGTY